MKRTRGIHSKGLPRIVGRLDIEMRRQNRRRFARYRALKLVQFKAYREIEYIPPMCPSSKFRRRRGDADGLLSI